MRILFVAWRDLPHPRAGGSEVLIDNLARALHARGHEVTVLCGGPTEQHEYDVRQNGGTYTQYLRAPLQYAQHFRDADLVVDTINGMPFFTPLWRGKPRLALLTHVHTDQWENYFPGPIASFARTVEGRGLPLVYGNTHFATISPSTASELGALGVARDQIHVMWLGTSVDTATADRCTRASEPTFVALGRLAPNKRLDLLLDLWARVEPKTGGRLVVIGDGPERARLEERVRTEPELRNVEFTGKVSEARKAELLASAWLLVHTAEREGWGLVIPEAGLCGTPSLAFDVPGVRDALEHGESGVLVRDDNEFVEQWVALTDDNEWRATLGAEAQRRATEFSWDRTVDDFLVAADAAIAANGEPAKGMRRSVRLFSLFRTEATDPDTFYHYLAHDTIRHVERYQSLAGAVAVDIGGGPGYIAEALKTAGAACTVVEYSGDELVLHERSPDRAVQADGQALPLRDGVVQLCLSSNVLEHVPDWQAMLSEMVRVLEPEHGLGYLTYTPWYGPWGGHETSPFHYLGGKRAVERYTKKYGKRPKNEFGVSLHQLHIHEVLDWFRSRDDVEIVWVGPRYLPEWMRWIVTVPIVREVVTWNLVVVFRRRAEDRVRSIA